VPSAASVFSNTAIIPEELAWLADQFGGQKSPWDDNEFNIELGSGIMDAVGLAEGTKDITSMPYQVTQDAARWLGEPPTYRLSVMIGDSQQCRELAWRIANEFGRWWPAVWSDHTAQPVVPLGQWWRR
jgi:hypothetical protein